jgi:Glycosyl transferase family 2
VPVTVIANGANRGYPAAVNQGLSVARGEYLVLLNNDAVVTDSWLDQLIALAEMKADLTTEHTESTEREGTTNRTNLTNRNRGIGLVGPMSNYASPPQLVEEVAYRGLEEMHAFARRWREEHRGQWFTAGKISGFCMLMKRAVYQAIGGLDERFGLGLFDDDDLAARARGAGFELAVAHDLFIHHFGSRTFAGNGIDAEALLQENGRRFTEKWGTAVANGRAVPLTPWAAEPQMELMRNWPQINTDEHICKSGKHVLLTGTSDGKSQSVVSECPSDLCSSVSICGSSLPAPKAKVVALPQSRGAPDGRPADRGGDDMAADLDPEASRAVLQRRPGHLRSSHPAQPRHAGPGARGRHRSSPPVAVDPRRMPRRRGGECQDRWPNRRRGTSDRVLETLSERVIRRSGWYEARKHKRRSSLSPSRPGCPGLSRRKVTCILLRRRFRLAAGNLDSEPRPRPRPARHRDAALDR